MPGGDDNLLDDSSGDEGQDNKKPSAAGEPKDHPSELAVDRIVDIIDFEIEHILWERMARKDHFESLEVRGMDVGFVSGFLVVAICSPLIL